MVPNLNLLRIHKSDDRASREPGKSYSVGYFPVRQCVVGFQSLNPLIPYGAKLALAFPRFLKKNVKNASESAAH